jgi:hypothetical protein
VELLVRQRSTKKLENGAAAAVGGFMPVVLGAALPPSKCAKSPVITSKLLAFPRN